MKQEDSPSAHSDLLNEIDVDAYFNEDIRPNVRTGFNFDIFGTLHNLLTSKEKVELEELNRQSYFVRQGKRHLKAIFALIAIKSICLKGQKDL